MKRSTILDTAIQLSAQGTIRQWQRNNEIIKRRFLIPDLNYKDDTLNLLFPWEWGLAISFWDHVIQILLWLRIFRIFFGKNLLLKLQFLFLRNSYVCPLSNLIFLIGYWPVAYLQCTTATNIFQPAFLKYTVRKLIVQFTVFLRLIFLRKLVSPWLSFIYFRLRTGWRTPPQWLFLCWIQPSRYRRMTSKTFFLHACAVESGCIVNHGVLQFLVSRIFLFYFEFWSGGFARSTVLL